jgi:phage terminase large subunit-like protein
MVYLNDWDVEIIRRRCLPKLSEFVKEFWDVIVPNPLVWNWHMQALCDEIQISDERVFLRLPKLYDTIFNIPPGTSKTKILSILSTAWEFARMPSIKVFVGSYSDAAVSGISDEIRLLMKSVKYKRCFPEVNIRSDKDSLHNFRTVQNGEFYAFTVGGSLTSKHADLLKVDDPLNPKQAASQAELTSANNFFDKTLPTRKVDKEVTPTYLVMQRLADNDPTGHLLKKKKEGIHLVSLPGVLSSHVKPAKYKEFYTSVPLPVGHPLGNKDHPVTIGLLDKTRLSVDALAELLKDLGASGYAGQIGQTPIPDGGLIWQKWFKIIDDDVFPKISDAHYLGTDWDLAYTEEEENAASAYITAGKIGNYAYIFDLDYAFLEFPELIKYMKLRRGPHYIEAKASGKSAKQSLTRAGIPAIEVKVMGGSDKVARAKMATPPAEAGLVHIKRSLVEKLYNDDRQGILSFPRASHKDLADALAQSMQRLFTGGIVVGNATDSLLDSLEDD